MDHLHPFFSYFGSKYALARYYQAPIHDEIIEPFAGSAGYSLWYYDKKITLYEIYEPIVELWKYLINVSSEEILKLPLGPFDKDHPIDAADIPSPAKTLLGFWNTQSQTSSSRYPLSKSRGSGWTYNKRKMIASQLRYIRHWTIEKLSFEKISNKEATWYIDPPYEEGGKRYKHNKIDYPLLAQWCKERQGQVIVCEQNNAKWLDFKSFEIGYNPRNASNKDYKEVVWYNSDNPTYEHQFKEMYKVYG